MILNASLKITKTTLDLNEVQAPIIVRINKAKNRLLLYLYNHILN